MSNDHRLGFLVIESEPAQGLSTRKLLLESAKHECTHRVFHPREGVDMFRRFPNVDVVAIDAGFGDAECTALVRHIKAVNQKIRVVAFTPNVSSPLSLGRRNRQLA